MFSDGHDPVQHALHVVQPGLEGQNAIRAHVQFGADLLSFLAKLLDGQFALRQLAARQLASGDMTDQSHAQDQQGFDQQNVDAPPARQQSPRGP